MIISRSIHVAADGMIFSFFRGWVYSIAWLYQCTPPAHQLLSPHSSQLFPDCWFLPPSLLLSSHPLLISGGLEYCPLGKQEHPNLAMRNHCPSCAVDKPWWWLEELGRSVWIYPQGGALGKLTSLAHRWGFACHAFGTPLYWGCYKLNLLEIGVEFLKLII